MRAFTIGWLAVVAIGGITTVATVATAEDARLTSQYLSDPSITVSEAPQAALPLAPVTGLVINPIFDASITSDPNGGTIVNTINAAIAVYEASFSDSVTVSIKFQEMTTGLGQSSSYIANTSYTTYLAALSSHATTVDDATALVFLPPGPNNPANGNANMWLMLANLRALGFVANPPPGQPDSTIGLRTSICNLDRSSIDPSKYDLMGVVSHEIDEALGLGSALNGLANGAPAPTGPVFGADLFRYDGTGSRSFNTTLASQAFFSIDGTTQLARFNQQAGGDFQDWFSTGPHTPQVQDAFATPGATADLGVELRFLDVIGYTPGSITPPSSTHDPVVLAPQPVTVTLKSGVTSVSKNLRVTVRNADTVAKPETSILLTASSSDCPGGTIGGLPDFYPKTPGVQSSVLLAGGKSKAAVIPLTITSAAFTTFNHKAPTRCTITLTASSQANNDPTPENSVATVELNVIDKNDPEQSTPHESLIKSIPPVTVTLKDGTSTKVKNVRPTIGNADILPAPENPGDLITVTASDGDCPAGTVGIADYNSQTPGPQNSATLKGGATKSGPLPLTINASAFATTNAKSPTRCTAVLTATGPSVSDPDPSNNTTKLVIDVVDKNDF